MAMGSFLPPRSAIRAAQSGTQSVSSSTDPTALLQSISRALWLLVDKIDPTTFKQRFSIDELAIGARTNGVNLTSPQNQFNAITICLQSGIVNIFMGGQLLYQVQATLNPTVIILPRTNITGPISFECDGLSPTAANGFIDFETL